MVHKMNLCSICLPNTICGLAFVVPFLLFTDPKPFFNQYTPGILLTVHNKMNLCSLCSIHSICGLAFVVSCLLSANPKHFLSIDTLYFTYDAQQDEFLQPSLCPLHLWPCICSPPPPPSAHCSAQACWRRFFCSDSRSRFLKSEKKLFIVNDCPCIQHWSLSMIHTFSL